MTFSWRQIKEAARWWATPPMTGANEIMEGLASWASSVVPDGYTAVVSDAGITISSGAPTFYHAVILLRPAFRQAEPREQSLGLALQVFAGAFQRNMTRIMGQAWPDEDADPHYSVTADELHVWWGGSTRQEAHVAVPPIRRSDVG
jgi:hypothetical protein